MNRSLIKDICKEMLINGNIDSFVNFFYLTHTTQNPKESNDLKSLQEKEKQKKERVKKDPSDDDEEDSEIEERRMYYEIETFHEDKNRGTETDMSKSNILSTDNLFNFNTLFVSIEECEKIGK